MKTARLCTVLLLTTWTLGCGSGDEAADGSEGLDVGDVVEAAAEVAESGGSSEAMEGDVSFEVDGQAYDFGHIVADESYSIGVGAAVWAKPDPSATEQFGLTVTGMDLDDFEYPATLPPEEAGTSIRTAMMMVGFSFTNADGEEWAGPGSLTVESFDDDVLVATFGETTLPHTDDELPDVTIGAGRIRVEF